MERESKEKLLAFSFGSNENEDNKGDFYRKFILFYRNSHKFHLLCF